MSTTDTDPDMSEVRAETLARIAERLDMPPEILAQLVAGDDDCRKIIDDLAADILARADRVMAQLSEVLPPGYSFSWEGSSILDRPEAQR